MDIASSNMQHTQLLKESAKQDQPMEQMDPGLLSLQRPRNLSVVLFLKHVCNCRISDEEGTVEPR